MNAPPDEALAAALAQVQEHHDANVAHQIAQAEISAKRRDAAQEYVEQHQDDAAADADVDGFVSPNVEIADGKYEYGDEAFVPEPKPARAKGGTAAAQQTPAPKPAPVNRKLAGTHVRRGVTWRRVETQQLKPGEPLYSRQGFAFVKCARVPSDERKH